MIITNEAGQVFEVVQKVATDNPESTKQMLIAAAALAAGVGGAKWRPIITAVARMFGAQTSLESARRFESIERRLHELELRPPSGPTA